MERDTKKEGDDGPYRIDNVVKYDFTKEGALIFDWSEDSRNLSKREITNNKDMDIDDGKSNVAIGEGLDENIEGKDKEVTM